MDAFDPKKVEEYITLGKSQEAKEYIQSFLKKGMTDEEKSKIHLDFAILELKVMNNVKEERNAALRQVLGDLSLLTRETKRLDEQVQIEEVRAKLKK